MDPTVIGVTRRVIRRGGVGKMFTLLTPYIGLKLGLRQFWTTGNLIVIRGFYGREAL